jgi:hypothetical protein
MYNDNLVKEELNIWREQTFEKVKRWWSKFIKNNWYRSCIIIKKVNWIREYEITFWIIKWGEKQYLWISKFCNY